MDWTKHLLVVPILLPLVTGAALLLIDETRHTLKAMASLTSTLVLLVVTVKLMRMADGAPGGNGALLSSYAVANWPAPFAIVLVLDRLSALMLAADGRHRPSFPGLLDWRAGTGRGRISIPSSSS